MADNGLVRHVLVAAVLFDYLGCCQRRAVSGVLKRLQLRRIYCLSALELRNEQPAVRIEAEHIEPVALSVNVT